MAFAARLLCLPRPAAALAALAAVVLALGCGGSSPSDPPGDTLDATADAAPDGRADSPVDEAGHPIDAAMDARPPGVDAATDAGSDAATAPDASGGDAAEGIDAGDAGEAADASDAGAVETGPLGTVSVLTQHNDTARTGANLAETILTPADVNASQFGKLFCWSVDDQVYTQPLVVTGVSTPSAGVRDLVYVATMNDTVYAFGANDGAASAPVWQRSFLATDVVPVRNTDMTGACGGNYQDISGNIGILSTPVIDPATSTMYLVARTKENGGTTFVQKLHAIDIRDGSERQGSPTTIAAAVPGTGQGGSTVVFDPLKNNQRASLLLSGGMVVIAWSSHCDWGPYHGWVMAYDAQSLQQVAAYSSTPDGTEAGIWMSGQGPAADSAGSIYLVTGNGTVDTSGVRNRGQSFLRLTQSGSTFTVASWFTPHDYVQLDSADLDLGSAGPLLVPGTNLVVSGGKGSKLYAADRTTMGGLGLGRTEPPTVQTVALNAKHLHGSPVYWSGPGGPLVYTWAEHDHLKSFHLDATASWLDPLPLAASPQPAPDGMPGASMSISANGATDGILWAYLPLSGDANQAVVPGELRAFDAANVGVELWNSTQNAASDSPGSFAKFTSPTVANGRVYLSTFSNAVCVYGLLPGVQPLGGPTGLTATATSKTSATLQWVSHSTTETSFSIERSEAPLGFVAIGTAPQGATSYVDATGVPFATYTYRVRALGTPAPSPYSNTASVVMNVGAPAPRLQVSGARHAIAAGSTVPSWTTDTDFAGVTVSANVTHTFTIANAGNAPLNITLPLTVAGTDAADFSVATAPPATLAPGASATFQVAFTPPAPGPRSATIQIVSDDPDQSPFAFAVGGVGIGDLLGYWAFDETSGQVAADSSGEGNNGAATGITWVTGHTGGAASFSGAASYVTVAESVSLDPYQITIAAWINPVDWAGNRRIVQKGSLDNQYRLLAENNLLKLDLAGVGTVTTALPAVATWTHVAGTYDGAAVRLYVNGLQVASTPATAPMTATTDPLQIGTKGPGSAAGDHFNGLLDEVRLYGRALSAAEIGVLAQ
jgi:hypothetical protein